jgi:hypothetical protein
MLTTQHLGKRCLVPHLKRPPQDFEAKQYKTAMHIRHFGTKQFCVRLLLQTTRVKLTSSLKKLIPCLRINKPVLSPILIIITPISLSRVGIQTRKVPCGRRNNQLSTHTLQIESSLSVHKYRWQYPTSACKAEVDSLCARLSARLVKIIVRKLQSYFLRNVAITPDEVYYDLPRPLAETA